MELLIKIKYSYTFFHLGVLHKVRTQGGGEGGSKQKAHIHCFGDVIHLLKCVQWGEGVVKYLTYLSVRTLWMAP